MRKPGAQIYFFGIRSKLFLCMFLLILALTVLVDIGVYRVYKQDVEFKTLSFDEEIIMELSQVMAVSVHSLEENMMYKITDSGMFDYQQNLKNASVFSVERKIQNFAALMNSRELNLQSVYIKDQYGASFYYERDSSSHERLEEFKKLEAFAYIRENHRELRDRRGTTFWRRFADDPDHIYLIKSSVNQNTLIFEGIVCVVIDKDYIGAMERNLSCNLAVYDERGALLYCNDSIADVAQEYGRYRGRTGGEKVFEGHLVAQSGLSKKGWSVVGFVSEQSVLASMRGLMIQLIVLEAVFLVLSALVAAWISKSMTQNISSLSENFRRINRGEEVPPVEYYSGDETAYLCEQFNDLNARLRDYVEQMAVNRTQREKAEYHAILAQMNPHFLYNTLESISSLAKLKDQREIVDAIGQLGRLLRASISGEDQEIPLERELEYVGKYLSLQKLMTGDKISWDIIVHDEVGHCVVPKLILQPLVENAIIHGIDDMPENAIIVIMVKREREKLLLEVCDNGKGMEQERADRLLREEEPEEQRRERSHIGIRSIQRRIEILYGAEYGLQIESSVENGTIVRVYLPLAGEGDYDVSRAVG